MGPSAETLAAMSERGSQGSKASTAGSASSVGQSGGAQDNAAAQAVGQGSACPMPAVSASGPNAECWFECGTRSTPDSKLINMGTAKYPRMVCGQCLSAKRALDGQARANVENKAALKELRDLRQGAYKELVRSSRIQRQRPGSGGHSEEHLRRKALLGNVFVEYQSAAQSYKREEEASGDIWPDRQEFIGYHTTFKGMTREEATAKWTQDSQDPAIEKRGTGSGLRLRVMAIPTSNSITGKRVSRAVQSQQAVDSASSLEAAAKRLRAGALSNDFAIAFGSTQPTGQRSSASGPAAVASAVAILDNDVGAGIDITYLRGASGLPEPELHEAGAAGTEGVPAHAQVEEPARTHRGTCILPHAAPRSYSKPSKHVPSVFKTCPRCALEMFHNL